PAPELPRRAPMDGVDVPMERLLSLLSQAASSFRVAGPVGRHNRVARADCYAAILSLLGFRPNRCHTPAVLSPYHIPAQGKLPGRWYNACGGHDSYTPGAPIGRF